jgi:hypothetical protein
MAKAREHQHGTDVFTRAAIDPHGFFLFAQAPAAT